MTEVDTLADGLQDAFSGRDPAAFAAVCALDVHYEDPLCARPLESVGALGDHIERLWTAFPDARMEAAGARLHDDRFAALPVKLLAHHRGELPELPPTDRFVVVHGVFYCELTDDRETLWRIRAVFDLYDAAVQLGVIPKPGSAGERAMLLLRGFGLRR